MKLDATNNELPDTGEWVPVNPEPTPEMGPDKTQDPGWEVIEQNPEKLQGSIVETETQDLDPFILRDLRETGDLDKAMDFTKGDLARSLELTKGLDAGKSKKIADLMKKLSLPKSAIANDLPRAEEIAQHQEVIESLTGLTPEGSLKYPRTMSYLVSPDKMAALRDDAAILMEMEDIVNSGFRDDDNFLQDTWLSMNYGAANMLEGIAKAPALIYEIAAAPQNLIADKFDIPSLRAHAPKWLRENPITDYLQAAARASIPSSKQTKTLEKFGEGDISGGTYDLIQDVAVNIPNLVGMGMTSAAGFSSKVTLSSMGAIEASNTFDEAVKSGKPYSDALTQALLSGTAEAVFEKFTLDQMGALLKSSGKEMVKLYGKEAATKKIARGLFKIAKDSSIEGSSEYFTEIAQAGADYITGNREALKGVQARGLHAFLVGAVTGGGMSTATQIRSEITRSRVAQEEKARYDHLKEKINNAKATKANPEEMEQFVEKLEPGAKIYIDPQDLREFQQSKKRKEKGQKIEPGQEIPIEKLDPDTKSVVDGLIDDEINDMFLEVEAAEAGVRSFRDAVKGGAPEVGVGRESNFPTWFQELETATTPKGKAVSMTKNKFFAAIKSKKTKHYEQIREVAIRRLKEGERDPRTGAIREPDNTFRNIVGLGSIVDGKLQEVDTSDVPFGVDTSDYDAENEFRVTLKDLEIEDQLEEAEALGHSFEISKAKWLVKYGDSQMEKDLNDKIKFTVEGYSTQDIKEIKDNVKDTLKNLADEQSQATQEEEDTPRQFEEARAFLMTPKAEGGQGMSAQDADASLSIFMEQAKRIAEKRGISVQKHLDNIGLRIEEGGVFTGPAPGELLQSEVAIERANRDSLGFYSGLEEILMGPKFNFKSMPAKNLLAQLQKTEGVKPEEMEFTGLKELLETTEGKVFKEDILKLVRAGGLQLNEIVKGKAIGDTIFNILDSDGAVFETATSKEQAERRKDELTREFKVEDSFYTIVEEERKSDYDDTKYGKWTLPGGENYREVLLQLPSKKEAPRKLEWAQNGDRFISDVEGFNLSYFTQPEGEGVALFRNGDEIGYYQNEEAARLDAEEDAGKTIGRQSGKDAYRSSHWDEENVLAHMRLADHTTKDGKKVLLVEEIQSDWHQAGRKKGYKGQTNKKLIKLANRHTKVFEDLMAYTAFGKQKDATFNLLKAEKLKIETEYKNLASEVGEEIDIEDLEEGKSYAVPDAPLKKTEAWATLAFKRILAMAVEQGYDSVALTPGQVQADRYDLSNDVGRIEYEKLENSDNYSLIVKGTDGFNILLDKVVTQEEMGDTIGKEIADRILADESGSGKLEGEGLKVGGEGMINFYDNILPNTISKYVKKLDKKAKFEVSDLTINTGKTKYTYTGPELTNKDLDNLDTKDFKVSHKSQFEEVLIDVVNGYSFKESMERNASPGFAEVLGGYITLSPETSTQGVLSLPITEKMISKVKEGQTLFQQGEDAPRASIKLDKYNTLIKLFKGADMTSLLHEGGHMFVRDLESLVADGVASEQDTKDLDTLKDFAGDLATVEAQEKLAEAFERYLSEGKAPSPQLVSAFNSFKQWFKRIYGALINKIEINDDVRGVFDRMLAAEDSIAEARAMYEQKGSLVDLLKVEPKKAKVMNDKKEEANKSAEEKLLAKHMRAFLKAIGGRKGVTKAVTERVNNLPEYQMLDELKEIKISEESIRTIGGEEALNTMKSKHRGTTAKDGKSLEELALEFDSPTPKDFIDELVNLPTKAERVKLETDVFILEKEQEILEGLSDNQMKEGTEEMHNDKNLSYLISEYELLLDKAKVDKNRSDNKINGQAFKEAAREILGGKTVKLASRYDLYAKSEVKFANLAYKFAKQGNYEKSLEAKKKQILNHIMVQEAVKIRDVKLKAEKFYSSKNLQSKLKGVEYDYMLLATDIIDRFKLHPAIAPTDEVPDVNKFDEYLAETLPDWVLTSLTPEGQTWKDMKYVDFIEVDEVVKSVLHAGKDTLLSLDSENLKSITDVVDSSVEKLDKLKDYKATSEQMQKRLNAKLAIQDLFMMEYIYEEMDDFSLDRSGDFGPMRTMNNRGRQAESESKEIMANINKEAAPHWEVLNKAANRIEKELGKFFSISGLPMSPEMQLEGRYEWTTNRLISMLLNMGNTHNRDVLKNAYTYTDEQLNLVSSMFTNEELQAVQNIWDVTNTLFKPLDETHFRIYNRHLPKVEGDEITLQTLDGEVTLPGGYYPLVFDRSISEVADKQQEDMELKDLRKSVLRSNKPKDGLTKKRVESAHNIPPMLDVSVWTKHISETARYISHSEYLRDMMKITGNKKWRNKVKFKFGSRLLKDLKENLQHQANPSRQVGGPFNRLIDKQRSLATVLILGLNASVGWKQRLSGFSADVDLGDNWVMSTMAKYATKGAALGSENSELWQEVRAKSKYIRAREGSMDREIRDFTKTLNPLIKRFKLPSLSKEGLNLKEYTSTDIKDAMFFWIQMNDRAMTGVVWMAAYRKSMSRTTDLSIEEAEKKAIVFADSIVATTQPSSMPLDLAKIQKDEGFIRLLTPFMTWTLKQQNRFRHKYRAWRAGAITSKEYYNHIFKEGLMASWGGIIIGTALSQGELPEWWEFLTSPVEYAVSGIPLVRDVPSAIKYNQGLGESTAFEVMNRHLRTGRQAAKATGNILTGSDAFKNEKEFHALLWSIGYSMEAQTGVPALKVVKNMKNSYDILTGKKQAEARKKRMKRRR